jgi:geranylgeranyl diphosphate synthase type II
MFNAEKFNTEKCNIEKYIEENKKIVNEFLTDYFKKKYNKKLLNDLLPKDKNNHPFSLNDAMFYTLSIGGKRIRPIFLLAAAEDLGFTEKEKLLPFASSLELIHSYSLIHDDLPAMDNDSLRRGKPTNHIMFGEASAILAGDGLLSEAFILLTDEKYINDFDCKIMINVIHELSNSIGADGLLRGQFLDINSSGLTIEMDNLIEIHKGKTAALVSSACAMGGILAEADENIILSLRNYGIYIGLAFQAIDDLLDIIGNSQVTGKTTGIDKNNKKNTVVSLLGIEKTVELIKDYTDKAIFHLDETGLEFNILKDLSYYLIKREH